MPVKTKMAIAKVKGDSCNLIYTVNTCSRYTEISLFMAIFRVSESEYIACSSISSCNLNYARKVSRKKH